MLTPAATIFVRLSRILPTVLPTLAALLVIVTLQACGSKSAPQDADADLLTTWHETGQVSLNAGHIERLPKFITQDSLPLRLHVHGAREGFGPTRLGERTLSVQKNVEHDTQWFMWRDDNGVIAITQGQDRETQRPLLVMPATDDDFDRALDYLQHQLTNTHRVCALAFDDERFALHIDLQRVDDDLIQRLSLLPPRGTDPASQDVAP